MAIPAEMRNAIDAWCKSMTPEEVRDRARLEAEVAGNKVTIFECTVQPGKADWLRVPSAQMRMDPQTRVWSLYWSDSHDRWHIVQVAPSLELHDLLAEVEADPDALFFG